MTSPTSETTTAAASPVLGQQPPASTTASTDTGTGLAATSTVLGQQPATTEGTTPSAAGTAEADPDAPVVSEPVQATVGVFYDADGREYYASPYSKATVSKLADGTWSTDKPQPAEVFDPSKHLVREVVAYLNEHAHDADEVARVKAAEEAGENRPSIAAWPPAQ